jgi:hypothetical protein
LAQGNLFLLQEKDFLGFVGQGIMQAMVIRCDNGLTYIAKDEPETGYNIRATELFWYLIARRIALPTLVPEVIRMRNGRTVFATRREQRLAAVVHADCLTALVSGEVVDGSRQLTRLYGFDLFCGNEDRKPDNYLLLREEHGIVVQNIDLGHTALIPGASIWPPKDPLYDAVCNTRTSFPVIISAYQSDPQHILDTIDRLEGLQSAEIETILKQIPDEWLTQALRDDVLAWWVSDAKTQRIETIRIGIADGTLF